MPSRRRRLKRPCHPIPSLRRLKRPCHLRFYFCTSIRDGFLVTLIWVDLDPWRFFGHAGLSGSRSVTVFWSRWFEWTSIRDGFLITLIWVDLDPWWFFGHADLSGYLQRHTQKQLLDPLKHTKIHLFLSGIDGQKRGLVDTHLFESWSHLSPGHWQKKRIF